MWETYLESETRRNEADGAADGGFRPAAPPQNPVVRSLGSAVRWRFE